MSKATIEPRWLSYELAHKYSSLSIRDLETLVSDKLVRSRNVRKPGKSRGRRLIDRLSLDAFIEGSGDEPAPVAMNAERAKKGAKP